MIDNGIRLIPRIEAVHVKNYRVLRDVQLREMTPLTVLIGPNGSGKSTLFDVFAFLAECFTSGWPNAWARRGGLKELRSRGQSGPVSIEVKYRERRNTSLMTYHLEIDEKNSSPIVAREWLKWRRGSNGQPFYFIKYQRGSGTAIGSDEPDEAGMRVDEPLSSADLLAVNTLGQFQNHPRAAALRRFITGWYLSYLTAPNLRVIREAGPERQLSATGENLANVLEHLNSSNEDHLTFVFAKLAERVPQFEEVVTTRLPGGSLLVQLKDRAFDEPILAKYISDGTMKLLAYLLVLHDPDPPPFVGIEEPENFVHPALLRTLAEECMSAAIRSQFLVTTHAPQFLDSLEARQVRVLGPVYIASSMS